MSGLILKDIFNLRQQIKYYGVAVLVWAMIAAGSNNVTFFIGGTCMFGSIIPITAMSYDEQAKWDKYCLTMPVSKRDIVLSKYYLGLISALVSFVIAIIISSIIGGFSLDTLLACTVTFGITLVAQSVMLPIIWKLGAEKARTIMMIVFLLPLLVVLGANKLGITIPTEQLAKYAPIFVPVIVLLIYVCSIYTSVAIYSKKDI